MTAVASVIAVIGITMAFSLAQGLLVRARLRRLKAARDEHDAVAVCVAEFSNDDPQRVRAAYEWVQALVAIKAMPMYPNDDLLGTLRLDQGDIEDKFEAAYECYGPEADGAAASSGNIETVRDLMAAVMASGYEGYPPRAKSEHAT